MNRITYTALAEADLGDIWIYVAEDSPVAADRLLDRIEEACSRLSEFPALGPARPDIAEGLRYLVVGRYLVLYRMVDDGIEVIRVVFGGRNLAALPE